MSFARLYALRNGVSATNTRARLDALRDRGVLKPQQHRDMTGSYSFLAERRHLPGAMGARVPEAELRRATEQAQLAVRRVSFDFLGSAL